MNKKIIRHNFNMVEIMLAVIVIALGIAGTFVLFPVGLNAARQLAAILITAAEMADQAIDWE